ALTDDRHSRSIANVSLTEKAPFEQWNPHGAEIIRRYRAPQGYRSLILQYGMAFFCNRTLSPPTTQRKKCHCACSSHAGNRLDLSQRRIAEGDLLSVGIVFGAGRRHPHRQHVLRVEAELASQQMRKTPKRQTGSREQDQRQRYL